MEWRNHSNLSNTHSFLSPSSHAWTNYSDEKLTQVFLKNMAKQKGTELHDLAARLIKLNVNLPDLPQTINMYVNDAIGFQMSPEVCLFFSVNCYGHADTISFKNNFLRIHDFKSGEHAASMRQLEVYAALFCLEYGYDPYDIQIELRIYQSCKIEAEDPDRALIKDIMFKIKRFDEMINKLRQGG